MNGLASTYVVKKVISNWDKIWDHRSVVQFDAKREVLVDASKSEA